MYYCANVVTGGQGDGSAVLIRAVEPVSGINEMSIRRFEKENFTLKEKHLLCNGPGKICIAFNIEKKMNGIDLCGNNIFISGRDRVPDNEIFITERVGIKKSAELKWRFYIKNNSYISKK